MARPKYRFDKDSFSFKREKSTVWGVLGRILSFFLISLSLAAVYYIIFSVFFSTDVERKLIRENSVYRRTIPRMEERLSLMEDVVEDLQQRDNGIYDDIFHAAAPSVDPLNDISIKYAADSLRRDKLVRYVGDKVEELGVTAQSVDETFLAAFSAIAAGRKQLPPMILPLENFQYSRTGASVGSKLSPFYKVQVAHNGIDLVASQGDWVVSTADGVVTSITRSSKGLGNVIEITHANGYKTRYAHLSDILIIGGEKVRRGRRIGRVGSTGNAFAPHLHYEVLHDGQYLDPADCFFGSVDADGYTRIKYMASMTGQSLD